MTREDVVDKYVMELYLTTSHKKTKRLVLRLLDDLDSLSLPPAEGAERLETCGTCKWQYAKYEYKCEDCRGGKNNYEPEQPTAEGAEEKVQCCPVCGGNGLVPNGFYSQTSGCWTTASISPEVCRSCNGTGVIFASLAVADVTKQLDELREELETLKLATGIQKAAIKSTERDERA